MQLLNFEKHCGTPAASMAAVSASANCPEAPPSAGILEYDLPLFAPRFPRGPAIPLTMLSALSWHVIRIASGWPPPHVSYAQGGVPLFSDVWLFALHNMPFKYYIFMSIEKKK